MSFIDSCMAKWKEFSRKTQPAALKVREVSQKIFDKLVYAWKYISKFRKIFLAAPVAVFAVVIAVYNLIALPAVVGVFIQTDGTYAFQMIREVAVLAPLSITAICLLLLFVSKRTLTPWMVTMLSLVLPLIILITNTFYQ